ncbi:MAG: hypothetical protein K8I30_08805 [Anaerolineae bacterium]|nr:hypothetical protein [Anaerolineae bacterium]
MFRFLAITTTALLTISILLLLAVLALGQGQSSPVLAYVTDQGIQLVEEWKTSPLLASDNINWSEVSQIKWSPDGQQLAYGVHSFMDVSEGYILSLADSGILGPWRTFIGASVPNWSPDSSMMAFSEVVVTDSQSGKVLDYLTQLEGRQPVWSPDGQMIAFGSGNEMQVMDANSGQIISDLTQPIFDSYPRFWRWSPDGRWLAFASFYEQDIFHITLSVIDLSNHEVRHLFSPIDFSTSPPIWSPDSQYLAFSTVESISPSRGAEVVHILNIVTGEDTVLAPQGINGSYFAQAWSPDSQWLTFLDVENRILYGINRSDDQPQILVPASYQPTLSTQLSPDGQQLAFIGATSNVSVLYVLDMKTRIISHLADNVTSPVWQP